MRYYVFTPEGSTPEFDCDDDAEGQKKAIAFVLEDMCNNVYRLDEYTVVRGEIFKVQPPTGTHKLIPETV